ncbi:hypothetical protein GALMADRAFT_148986 [Galerina marginata CBS 339.88]|uniref:Uncharacterized protein n=1 Tax=Galerina marginata (strain CBS 339.88) TaxID=685588 RepID=A0A067SBG9_GALM3|nr:hypothetical protein GALMADRAFT_148986 [Galerina marginata CBS 339.88]
MSTNVSSPVDVRGEVSNYPVGVGQIARVHARGFWFGEVQMRLAEFETVGMREVTAVMILNLGGSFALGVYIQASVGLGSINFLVELDASKWGACSASSG